MDRPEKPFGEIDFGNYTLIGIDEQAGRAKSLKSNMGVCSSDDGHTFIFKIRYSLKDQCAGSGIFILHASFWAIIPKISEDDHVIFEPLDVNPYQD